MSIITLAFLASKSPAAFPVVFGLFYLTNIVFDCLEGRFDIFLFSLPFIALHTAIAR
jgi:hypothetical protein